jgi:transposase-like protein
MISSPDPLDDEFPQDDGAADTEAEVKCPYCGETIEIALDPGGGVEQEYVEDCQVCCRPWTVRVTYNASGTAEVEVEATDDVDEEE